MYIGFMYIQVYENKIFGKQNKIKNKNIDNIKHFNSINKINTVFEQNIHTYLQFCLNFIDTITHFG